MTKIVTNTIHHRVFEARDEDNCLIVSQQSSEQDPDPKLVLIEMTSDNDRDGNIERTGIELRPNEARQMAQWILANVVETHPIYGNAKDA